MLRMPPLTNLAFMLKRAALVATLGLPLSLMVGCAMETNHYSLQGDAKPHPGVVKAQRLPIHGIDVSKWQGTIDWRAVRAAGAQFAFIKATEGGDVVDDRFAQNYAAAKAAGVQVGAYHFVYWCRSAHEQAEWFKQHIPTDPDALPPVLDVEWNGHSKTCPKKVPREEAVEKMRVMLKELEALTGKRPIIYTDITFHQDVMSDGSFDAYPFWVRTVAAEPQEKYGDRHWNFWQYTTTGRVPGIRGDVDRNAFNGTAEMWEKWLKGG
jgi:lysozyme